MRALEIGSEVPTIAAVVGCVAALEEASFPVLYWESLQEGLRPPPLSLEGVEEEPNQHGWRKLAARSLEIHHLSDTWPTLTPTGCSLKVVFWLQLRFFPWPQVVA